MVVTINFAGQKPKNNMNVINLLGKTRNGIKLFIYSKFWLVKMGLTLIVVNGCMFRPITESLFTLSSISDTSSSNFLFCSLKFSCFRRRVLNCCSRTRSWVIFLLLDLNFPSHTASCTTMQGFSFSTMMGWTTSVDTAVTDLSGPYSAASMCILTSLELGVFSCSNRPADWSIKIIQIIWMRHLESNS